MRPFYEDIIKRAGPPEWFDEYGVPRYGPFKPGRGANVFAREATLVQIRCRASGASFKVAFSRPSPSPVPAISISELIATGQLCYGDPPNMECCSKSAFSRSIAEKVLEYWQKRDARKGWRRDPTLEIELCALLYQPQLAIAAAS